MDWKQSGYLQQMQMRRAGSNVNENACPKSAKGIQYMTSRIRFSRQLPSISLHTLLKDVTVMGVIIKSS